jgi:uncharacterized membrane protein YphA (DoxX/SURF4 family)
MSLHSLYTSADSVLIVTRILSGVILLASGVQRLLAWYGGPGLTRSMRSFVERLKVPAPLERASNQFQHRHT